MAEGSEIKVPSYREEIPYDEDGIQLSFNTDAKTVYVDGVPLKTWLDNLKAELLGQAKGKDGDSFAGFDTDYAAVSEANNNIDYVKTIELWSSTSPALTREFPHLWKRITSKKVDGSGNVTAVNIEYQYCGSLGQSGVDAEWKEWIFRLTNNNKSEEQIKGTLEAELDSYYSSDPRSQFQQNDFIPGLWNDDMQTVNDTNVLQWCASRYKKDGIWSKFGNVHIFGRKPLDGVTNNNIYTVASEIEETKWEQDKQVLIDQLLLQQDAGTISNFPINTNYAWVDFVPNTSATEVIYQATAYFQGSSCINIDAPVRITGPAGPGSDGNGIEFAYCAIDHPDPEPGDFPPFEPDEKHFKTVQGQWYDTAGECPITPTSPYQYVRQRLGQYTDENNWYWIYSGAKYGVSSFDTSIKPISEAPEEWNFGWSKPMLWSSWGVDGVDGDGVQYVYVRLTEEEYQFVSKDRNRWNFDGDTIDIDVGDLTNPDNPNNPINWDYEYTLEAEEYTAVYPLTWNGDSVQIQGVTGTYIAYNGLGEIIKRGNFGPIAFVATVPKEPNTGIYPIEQSAKFSYNGKALPGNDLERFSITGTVKYIRNPKDADVFTYYVTYALNNNDTIVSPLPADLCPGGKNPETGSQRTSDTSERTAPLIEGYVFVERPGAPKTQFISTSNRDIVFYYSPVSNS